MAQPAATASNISGFILYALANLLGLANLLYAVRNDLAGKKLSLKTCVTTIAQSFMSATYALSFAQGYQYEANYSPNDPNAYNRGLRLSDAFFMCGTFLLVFSLQALLPAVQARMRYNEKWNKLLKSINFLLFAVCICGYVATTILIYIADDPSNHAISFRMTFFTIWAIYSPLMMITISVLVCRMVIEVKRTLAVAGVAAAKAVNGATDAEAAGDHSTSSVDILDSIKRRAIGSSAICTPITIGVAAYTTTPYSALQDGIATLYTSIFCAWLIFTIHIIRQVVRYSPSASTNSSSAKNKKLFGLNALKAANPENRASVTIQSERNGKTTEGRVSKAAVKTASTAELDA